MEDRYKNLITRAFTGAVFVIVLVGGITLNKWTFFLLFFAITVLAIGEFNTLLKNSGRNISNIQNSILGAVIYLVLSLSALKLIDSSWQAVILPALILPFITELFRKDTSPYENIAISILCLVYLALPFSLLNYIASTNGFNPMPVLGFIILIWVHDTGSYIAGFTLGKTPLFQRVSPKKTWEGSVGGFLFTVGAAVAIQQFIPLPGTIDWISIALIIVVFGTFGDLVESLLKRNLGVKDSGNILPGHGGILDRFDSLVFAAPVIYCYLRVRGIV